MKTFLTIGAALLGLSEYVNAAAVKVERMEMMSLAGRDNLQARQAAASCNGIANSPNRRDCWTPGFSKFNGQLSSSSTDQFSLVH